MFNRILKIQICLLSIFCFQAVAGQNSNAVISLDYVGVYSWDKVIGKRNAIDDGSDRIISGTVHRAIHDSIQAFYLDGSAAVMVEIFIKNISAPIAGMELSFECSAATDSTFGFYTYSGLDPFRWELSDQVDIFMGLKKITARKVLQWTAE